MTHSLSDAPGITSGDVEAELGRGVGRLAFSPKLESAFDRHERATRTRYLLLSGLSSACLYVAFLLFDWALIPDVLALACWLRLAVFAPLMGALLLVIARAESQALREGSRAAMAVFATALIMVLLSRSHSPYRAAYSYGTVLIMFHVIVLRLRFRYAAAALAGVLVVQVAGVEASGVFDDRLRVSGALFFGSAVTAILTAVYGMEHETRRSYLLSLQSRLLQEEFGGLANLDALTGLLNRRSMESCMHDFAARARPGDELSVVIADIDKFKAYNDLLGHLQGDECLKEVARCFRDVALRCGGDAIRFGGEEFVLLMRGAGPEQAAAAAAALRSAVEARAIPHPAAPAGIVTSSFGVASARVEETTLPALLAAADGALYAAKRAGGRRIRVAGAARDARRAA